MSTDPRAALSRLIAAFEAHYDAVAAIHDEDSPIVVAATQNLADAFDTYDDALMTTFGVDTPFDIYDDDDYDDDYDDGDDDGDDYDDDYDDDDEDDLDDDDDGEDDVLDDDDR